MPCANACPLRLRLDRFTSRETITVIYRTLRRNRHTFRPTLGGYALEDRLVLSTSGGVQALVSTPAPAPAPVSPAMAVARVRRAILQQTRSLATDVRSAINKQITALYANGKPTAQQIEDFNSAVMGISDAAALRLSSQADLLPGSSARLIPGLQNALLGSG